MLQRRETMGVPGDGRTCGIAAWGGHLRVLQWARASGCPLDADACLAAARGNRQVETLSWLSKNGPA